MAESIGYDAFAAAGGGGGAPAWEEGPDLSTAERRVYTPAQHQRPSSTGADDGGAPAMPAAPSSYAPAARGAGVGLLFAALGTAAGATFGGWWGAGAGLLMAGAVRNGARARKLWASADAAEREEAAASITMAVIGGGAGAYLGYRAYRAQQME